MSHESAPSLHSDVDLAEQRLQQALRSLPARIPPPGLTVALRVIASRERQRFVERRTWRRMLATWRERASLSAGETMRSLVLPLTGGVCTAVVLFSTWLVPTYPLHVDNGFDVATRLTTSDEQAHAACLASTFRRHDATVTGTGVIGLSGRDAVVDVTVDNQGSVVDIAILSGAEVLQDADQRHRLENLLLRTQFAPATESGRPVASKVRFAGVFSSQIDVKD
jgi:hypothetical protein